MDIRDIRALPLLSVAVLLLWQAPPLRAQGGDTVVARVQRLVNAGDRAGARRLADSLVAVTPEATPAYAEALYARAFASSSAVEAERDYLRVSIEYPFSPRAEDATMMVAQLKLARSDRLGARRNFERLVREHPTGTQGAKAAFWAGRLALEDGDIVRGCPSLGRAKARVSPDDVELANQIDYYAQRCSAGSLAGGLPEEGVPVDSAPPVPARTVPPPRAVTPSPARVPAPKPAPKPEPPPEVIPEVVRERVPEPPPAEVVLPPVPTKEYSVQLAGVPRERDAQALVEVLRQRGFSARVFGTRTPFRVRVGRYASMEEAAAAMARLKASRLNGTVVEAEPQ